MKDLTFENYSVRDNLSAIQPQMRAVETNGAETLSEERQLPTSVQGYGHRINSENEVILVRFYHVYSFTQSCQHAIT